MMVPAIKRLVTELRRRRVFRTAGYYIVGAWVLLQVCELLFDVLQLPSVALRWVLAVTVAGFPVALIIGWRYDITATGITRTPSAAEATGEVDLSLKRVDHLLSIKKINPDLGKGFGRGGRRMGSGFGRMAGSGNCW